MNNFFKRNRNPELEALKSIGGDVARMNAMLSLGKLASKRTPENTEHDDLEPWISADIIQVDFGTGERIIPVEPLNIEETSSNFRVLKPRPGRSDNQTAG